MKILLDEHFPEAVAAAVRRAVPGFDIQSIHAKNWEGLLDAPLLEILDAEGTTLVTRDVNTIPRHMRARLSNGQTHGGIVFVRRSILQNNSRVVIRRLVDLIKKRGKEDWQCQEGWI